MPPGASESLTAARRSPLWDHSVAVDADAVPVAGRQSALTAPTPTSDTAASPQSPTSAPPPITRHSKKGTRGGIEALPHNN